VDNLDKVAKGVKVDKAINRVAKEVKEGKDKGDKEGKDKGDNKEDKDKGLNKVAKTSVWAALVGTLIFRPLDNF